jgi:hypothetical protein
MIYIFIGFEVLTDVVVNVGAARWFIARLIFCPEDGGDTSLRNIG